MAFSGFTVVVEFAGPESDHCLHSTVMSGWLASERRIPGLGTGMSEDMLRDDIRALRFGSWRGEGICWYEGERCNPRRICPFAVRYDVSAMRRSVD